jgi:hypothetical protein
MIGQCHVKQSKNVNMTTKQPGSRGFKTASMNQDYSIEGYAKHIIKGSQY